MDSPGQGLHRKLVWLTFFRLVSVTVLLGGTAASGVPTVAELQGTMPLYGIVLVTYLASLGFAVLLRARVALAPLAYAQIALDVGVSGAVVALTGGAESVFVFMYLLGIVNGAILLYRSGALVALAVAAIVHLGVQILAPGGAAGEVPWSLLGLQGSAFTLSAVLASYLAEQLRRTGERLAERESDLATITALHEAIVQSVTSGLVTLDARGRVTFMNRAGEQLTGLALERIRGGDAATWFPSFHTDMARGETDFRTPRGDRLRFGYSSFRLVGRDGETFGTALIFQDLTELRAMEERVARSERLADLGAVASGLAHELRNPLAAMMGAVDLLRRKPDLDGEDRRLMEIALREASRLEQLVTDFLGFARPAPARRVPCDLAPLLAETLDVFAHDPGAAVTTERDLAPAPAHCDPGQLKQVIWNLLRNAAEAAAGRPGREGGGRVRAACGADAEGAWLSIEDDGPGIPPDDRTRIFLPFFTTRKEGTGLGLSTVHRIVDAHGGSIGIETPDGGGARFVVRIPDAPRGVAFRAAG
jgi:two-component system sensor histidine kinase PilS (NtrC family)